MVPMSLSVMIGAISMVLNHSRAMPSSGVKSNLELHLKESEWR